MFRMRHTLKIGDFIICFISVYMMNVVTLGYGSIMSFPHQSMNESILPNHLVTGMVGSDFYHFTSCFAYDTYYTNNLHKNQEVC